MRSCDKCQHFEKIKTQAEGSATSEQTDDTRHDACLASKCVQWSAELCEKVILRHKFDTLIDDASKITMNKCPFQPNHVNGEHILSLCRHIMDKYAAIYPLITLLTYTLTVSSRFWISMNLFQWLYFPKMCMFNNLIWIHYNLQYIMYKSEGAA